MTTNGVFNVPVLDSLPPLPEVVVVGNTPKKDVAVATSTTPEPSIHQHSSTTFPVPPRGGNTSPAMR